MHESHTLMTEDTLEHRLNLARNERDLWHEASDDWPIESSLALEDLTYSVHRRDGFRALLEEGLLDEGKPGIVRIRVVGGTAYVSACGESPDRAAALLEKMRERIPRAEDKDPGLVPVTFWSLSTMGPQSMRRMIDAPAWDSIEENYPRADEISSMLRDWRPGAGGQLLLWHGEAGTGKTTALRSLGREWRDWAELHYIVDPDKFFGESAAYMMQVMMGADEKPDGAQEPKWRVLLLEDCGEMLQPDARQEVGQALSRLLNACDGLIGRGLRLLILITTNEALEKLHPAVSRPGRCAHRIEFPSFDRQLASEWLGADVDGGKSLADLFALREGNRAERSRQPVGFAA
jgi:hypothetical protein